MYSEVTRPFDNTVSVSVSASRGNRMVVRSTFAFDHEKREIDTSFRVSKNAENVVGRQYVCSAISHAYKLSICHGNGSTVVLKGYRISSTEVKGKPRNARIAYALEHALALQESHNNDMMRRHMMMNMFAMSLPPPSMSSSLSQSLSLSPSTSPSPSPSLSPSPPASPPPPEPSYLFSHRPMPPGMPMHQPLAVPTGIVTSPLSVSEGKQECSLCMEEPESMILFQVTCCIGKTICGECMSKLSEFARMDTNPLCPWCRS